LLSTLHHVRIVDGIYPLVNIQKAIENCPFVVDLSNLKMVVFQFANCKRLPARVIHVIEKIVFFTKYGGAYQPIKKKSPVIASCSGATTDDKPCDVAGFHGDFPSRWMTWKIPMENCKNG